MCYLGHEPHFSAPFSALLVWLREREALDHQISRELATLRAHQDSLQNELRAVRDDLQSVDQQLQATIEVCMGLVFGPQGMPPDAEGSPES